MIVRHAIHADIPSILDIYNEAVLNTTATADYEPSTLEMRTAWFAERAQHNLPIIVAEDASGHVVGWSSLSPYHTRIGYRFTAEVSVYVAADQRGQGIGKLLLLALIEAAKSRGLHTLLASIDASNQASRYLHAGLGFEQVGYMEQVITKFDRWLDVIYMQLLLDDAPPPTTER